MLVRFRLGNVTETRPVHGKLDHHVSAGRKRDGFKQRHVSVEFTKYGNTLFRPVLIYNQFLCLEHDAYNTLHLLPSECMRLVSEGAGLTTQLFTT